MDEPQYVQRTKGVLVLKTCFHKFSTTAEVDTVIKNLATQNSLPGFSGH